MYPKLQWCLFKKDDITWWYITRLVFIGVVLKCQSKFFFLKDRNLALVYNIHFKRFFNGNEMVHCPPNVVCEHTTWQTPDKYWLVLAHLEGWSTCLCEALDMKRQDKDQRPTSSISSSTSVNDANSITMERAALKYLIVGLGSLWGGCLAWIGRKSCFPHLECAFRIADAQLWHWVESNFYWVVECICWVACVQATRGCTRSHRRRHLLLRSHLLAWLFEWCVFFCSDRYKLKCLLLATFAWLKPAPSWNDPKRKRTHNQPLIILFQGRLASSLPLC